MFNFKKCFQIFLQPYSCLLSNTLITIVFSMINVLFRDSIFCDETPQQKSKLGKNGFICLRLQHYYSSLKEVRPGAKAAADTSAMEVSCLLACFLLLVHPTFLWNELPTAQG